jgi:hydroxyacylglutathione hydrolase
MNLETIVVGEFQSNCFVIWNSQKEAAVIDPGADADTIAEFLRSSNLSVAAYLQTHGHMDHICGLADMCDATPAKVHIHPADAKWAFSSQNEWPPFYSSPRKPECAISAVQDGAEIEVIGLRCVVLATPGHTAGSVCYYFPAEKTLFSGDTLFAGSVGRTDFPGGSSRELALSLKKLAALPADTVVHTGHGPSTTIGEEKRHNYFMQNLA